MDPRQAAITTGQAYNIAAQLLTNDPEYRYSESTPQELNVIAQEVFPIILDAQVAAEAAATVGNAFPGTVAVAPQTVPQVAVAPAPAPQAYAPQPEPFPAAQAPQGAHNAPGWVNTDRPAPIPGATGGNGKKDAAWQAFFADPSAYYDNRVNKRNPNGPDFKHKQSGEGLWLGGQYPAPAWVLQRLGVAA